MGSGFPQCPKLTRGHASIAAEVAGEGTLITPASLERDVGERFVRLAQQARGLVEAELVQQLQWAHLKKALHTLLELINAQPGLCGNFFDAEAFSKACLHQP